jgi:hypothetical protein
MGFSLGMVSSIGLNLRNRTVSLESYHVSKR